ncbi:hypothetical protein SAMN05660690_3776 [Geodermatophilus telluris]|uniref:Uncharacterized protein n=1 Tax=Geodermatophilus telluris TaxID=1190417 RepID=A0A1G6T8F8_9ACTN|nr:hypothetical protein [Geodermatophilus telluris]SDD24816.1 hypothetical protein SAMN05660690_3776 [Geodermatophilus telluris]
MVRGGRGRVATAWVALGAGAVLTAGCAGVSDAAAPVSPAAATTPAVAPASPDALRDRLLPAAAFGADATVVGLTLEQAGTGLAGLAGDWWDGDTGAPTVEPALCGSALGAVAGAAGSPDAESPVLVAQAALGPQARTVEVLAESPALAGVQLPVDRLLAACATVTVTAPGGETATVGLSPLDAPELGDAGAALRVTVDRAGQATATALVGIVVDGGRGLLLAQTAAPGAAEPDPGAFTALLGDAAEAAAG